MRLPGDALSIRESQTVAAVQMHYASTGRPPSTKEVAAIIGLEKSQTYDLVKQAARKGFLKLHCRKGHRTEIRLTRPLSETSTADLIAELAERDRPAPALALTAGNDPEDLDPAIAA